MKQEFVEWVASLSKKYKQSQIKASIRVNLELLKFYFELGKEINESNFKKEYGNRFFIKLSDQLKKTIPNSSCFSTRNLRYVESFYILYKKILQQLVAKLDANGSSIEEKLSQQLVEKMSMVPWGHHTVLIDKCINNPEKALFYINRTIEHNWSRNVLSVQLSTNLYEREGKAINNFDSLELKENSDLVKQLTKDPYNFDFLEMSEDFKEKELKESLVTNIRKLLLELGSGFAFVGQEYRLFVGQSEFYVDLLFYNIPLHAYVVIEIKTTSFKPDYLGQLGLYVSAVNHNIKGESDNKTIGLLICKDKDNVVAQYSLENYGIPLGISSFELNKKLSINFKNSLPTIEELETNIRKNKKV